MTDQNRRGGARAESLPPRRDAEGFEEVLRAAPGLARIAVGAGWRTAGWAVGAYVHTASRMVRAASRGESTGEVMQETSAELRGYARSLLGLSEGAAEQEAGRSAPRSHRNSSEEFSRDALRRRGSELLRSSADVRFDDASHPAYMRILEALAPDEGRILRLLAAEGPQPAVDVRSGLPLISELVAPGCNMIGEQASCRHLDRVHAYLDNLHRLGLIWFSREHVKDLRRYQVLEAQPEVVDARAEGGHTARTIRRSILLTSFGEDFCAVCLPSEDRSGLSPRPYRP